MNKVKEKLVALETGTKPASVSSASIGMLQVRSMRECKEEKSLLKIDLLSYLFKVLRIFFFPEWLVKLMMQLHRLLNTYMFLACCCFFFFFSLVVEI